MLTFKEQYLVGAEGNRIEVVLDAADYQRLLEALEELDDLRAYDEAEAFDGEAIPREQAIGEIERAR